MPMPSRTIDGTGAVGSHIRARVRSRARQSNPTKNLPALPARSGLATRQMMARST